MTRQEALMKIEKYKKKMRVMGVEYKFEFDIREDEDGEVRIVITKLYAEQGEEICIPSFVSYLDTVSGVLNCSEQTSCSDYTIFFPDGCDVLRGYIDSDRFVLRFSNGIAVGGGNPHFASEDGVLFRKDKRSLCLYPKEKRDALYTIPESVCRIEEGAFDITVHLEKLYIHGNVTEIGLSSFFPKVWIEVDEKNAVYKSVNGSLYSKDGKILYHLCETGNEPIKIEEGTVQVHVPDFYKVRFGTHEELYIPSTIEPTKDLVTLFSINTIDKFIVPEKLRDFIKKLEKEEHNIIAFGIYVEYY
ncbi:MAG: hypothetical protein IJ427_04510 [Lachnospiraceae bacterium]|nr:hypothetical protein [Lachnospiraceae bacterium]